MKCKIHGQYNETPNLGWFLILGLLYLVIINRVCLKTTNILFIVQYNFQTTQFPQIAISPLSYPQNKDPVSLQYRQSKALPHPHGDFSLDIICCVRISQMQLIIKLILILHISIFTSRINNVISQKVDS